MSGAKKTRAAVLIVSPITRLLLNRRLTWRGASASTRTFRSASRLVEKRNTDSIRAVLMAAVRLAALLNDVLVEEPDATAP